MTRGDIISVAVQGDYGKPRPAVVVQTDLVPHTDSVLVTFVTGDLSPSDIYRVSINADEHTGLRKPSEIMAEKTMMVMRRKCGPVFGRVPDEVMAELNQALIFVFGLGEP